MSGIGKNRVFDRAALEELKSRIVELMQTAQEVTEAIREEMNTLQGIGGDVPAEAKHDGLYTAAQTLAGELDTEPYLTFQAKISSKIDELNAEIPAFDVASAGVLKGLTAAAGDLTAMLEDLKGLIGQGSLKMSPEEFSGKLEEYRSAWEQGGKNLEAKMALAMTYLKGLVKISEYSKDPVNLSTGNFYYEREDMTVRGRMPLTLKRHYNAMDRGGGALGQGWSHSLEERLTFAGGNMNKIDEEHDNDYLTPAQDTEEKLNSVDYDVWVCPNCGETDIIPFDNADSEYSVCPLCGSKACYLVSDRVIRKPTTRREGQGVKTYYCKNCHQKSQKPYDIAKVPVPPVVILPPGGGGGGGFGGGFGGGSFGGGATGGGGASGGW